MFVFSLINFEEKLIKVFFLNFSRYAKGIYDLENHENINI